MGLWGAAQAIAFGVGGLPRHRRGRHHAVAVTSDALAYGAVFAVEGLVFLVAAVHGPADHRAAHA
jgi:BCD family chlorophyll transporter-like MFS transporter